MPKRFQERRFDKSTFDGDLVKNLWTEYYDLRRNYEKGSPIITI